MISRYEDLAESSGQEEDIELADLITNGEDGLLVPIGNIEKLAESIEWMITHEEERLRMRNNARLKAKQYTAETIMPQWVELFEKVAKQ